MHQENAEIDLQHPQLQDPQDSTSTGRMRKLLVDYHPPSIHYAFSAALKLQNNNLTSHLKLGHTYPVNLQLRYTTKWSHQSQPQSQPQTPTHRSFVYEILPASSWLLSGPRLATFEAEADVDIMITLSLTPLVVGTHSLPAVKVRLATKEQDIGKGGDGSEEGTLQVELRSQYQVFTVTEGLTSTTVSLGARGEIGNRMELLEAGA